MTPPWPWVAIVVGGVMVVVGAVHGRAGADVDVGTVPPVVRAAAPIPAPFATIAPRAPVTAAPVAGGPPVRLRIPVQGIDAPVVGVDVGADGALGVPDDPDDVGWWRDGAAPGAPGGSVVLDGHVDTYDKGPGALFRLVGLRPGDAVQLVLRDGTADYRVVAVRAYVKADLPADVFDRDGTPRLVLISCGGPFDRAHRTYRDNIVVYGVPSGGS